MNKILVIEELCRVDYIDAKNYKEEIKIKDLKAIRTVEYRTEKDTLIEALTDYINNWNCEDIINCNDDFDGACLDSVIISAKLY